MNLQDMFDNTSSHSFVQGAKKELQTPYGLFPSVKDAAVALGITTTTVRERMGWNPNEYYYTNRLFREKFQAKWNARYPKQPVYTHVTPMGSFNSLTEAAKVLNLTKEGVRQRLISSNFPDWTSDAYPKKLKKEASAIK